MTEETLQQDRHGSLILAMIWMLLLSLLLFWLPLFGPLIAGFVGGRTAGSGGRGILAAILPSLLLAFLLFLFSTALTGVPLIGIIAGAGVFVLMAFQAAPLIVGGLIGGLTV